MDLPAARLNVQIPEFLLSGMWTLPEKLKNVSLERRGPFIIVHFQGPLRSYQLPRKYAKMVSRRDIHIVNSKLKRFTLTLAVKYCDGVFRIPYDYKHFTWDLVLKEIPRNRFCTNL